ncbi:MAG: lysophospholipase [Geminicoccaceae bacterium]
MIPKLQFVAAWSLMILTFSACVPSNDAASVNGMPSISSPWRHWQPDRAPTAVILALHGFNDYSNAFQDFAGFARDRGIAVHAYDQRGFGANPDAGLWPGMDRLVADLHGAVGDLRLIYPQTPLYVLGESMGGAVTIVGATSEAPLPVDGLILVAPAVWGGSQLNAFYRATLWLASTIAPGWKLSGSSLEILPSDNIDMLRAFSADPLVIKGTRVDAIAGLVELMDQALLSVSDLDQEVLILVGEKDEVVPAGAFTEMRERLHGKPCAEVSYPTGYHMLLRDLQRTVVFEDVAAWIEGGVLLSTTEMACPSTDNDVAAGHDP